LQRTAGNAAVASLVRSGATGLCGPFVQRLADTSSDATGADAVPSGPDAVSVAPPPDFSVPLNGSATQQYAVADLQAIDPTFQPPGSGDGSVTVLTLPAATPLQRQSAPTGLPDKPSPGGAGGSADPNSPHLSTDLGAGGTAGATYPWTLTTTVVYRNLNYRTFPGILRGLDILHEPSASFQFSIAPQSLLSAQLGVGLVNLHLGSLFGTELEAQILGQLGYDSTQGYSAAGGVQLEQHIWKGISATFTLTGGWTVPPSGGPAAFGVAPGGGLTIHTDAF
jgi:hypothetical protein